MSDSIYDVFISYNSIDRDAVLNIVVELQQAGLSVWFDQWKLRPGKTWQEVAVETSIEAYWRNKGCYE